MSRESVTDVMRKAADFLPAQLAEQMSDVVASVVKLMEAADLVARGYETSRLGVVSSGDISDMRAALSACKGVEQTDEH